MTEDGEFHVCPDCGKKYKFESPLRKHSYTCDGSESNGGENDKNWLFVGESIDFQKLSEKVKQTIKDKNREWGECLIWDSPDPGSPYIGPPHKNSDREYVWLGMAHEKMADIGRTTKGLQLEFGISHEDKDGFFDRDALCGIYLNPKTRDEQLAKQIISRLRINSKQLSEFIANNDRYVLYLGEERFDSPSAAMIKTAADKARNGMLLTTDITLDEVKQKDDITAFVIYEFASLLPYYGRLLNIENFDIDSEDDFSFPSLTEQSGNYQNISGDRIPLTDIPATGDTRANNLRKNGYTTVSSIADASIEELASVPTITRNLAGCIREGARELRGDDNTIQTQIAKECNCSREEVADIFASIANLSGSLDTKTTALREYFSEEPEDSIFQLKDHSVYYLYPIYVEGYRRLETVAAATVSELSEANYVDNTQAANIRNAAKSTLEEGESSHLTSTNQNGQIVSKNEARLLLEKCVGPDARFRSQQWEAIHQLVNNKEKLLLVQRTGWGKSTVYFIATKLLRQRGQGPTLIISPLLSLMRNQIEDAEDELGLTAVTINSNNQDQWDDAKAAVLEGDCDILLISPERLANQEFRDTVLTDMDAGFGMLVVDEAHCISDWGHDFRPDYRRVKRILERLPDGTPVAATTATANDRVVEDVTTQLPGLKPMRGDLVRDSLKLQVIELTSRERRLAWITENFPDSAHSGIIYCLTTEDVETVAAWLDNLGYDTLPYHGRLDGDVRREREESLIENEVDALVATNALGMGFNKPDLGFVIHFQRPPNLIQYYQEIGRAGRELGEAQAVLLSGEDDDDIAEYFIESAFPEPEHFEKVLHVIADSKDPMYKRDVAKQVNIPYTHIDTCLDILQVEQAIVREENGYVRTPNSWEYDYERVQRVTEQRWNELEEIKKYAQTDKCLTQFIDNRLDGTLNTNCGHCANCVGPFVPTTIKDERLVKAAQQFYQERNWRTIKPRKRVPERSGSRSTIPKEERLESGRALSVWDDPGLGELVRIGKYEDGKFSDRLVQAAAEFITEEWDMNPEPKWITVVPCKSDPGLISDFGERLARALSLNFEETIEKVHQTQPQKQMENSYHKCWNIKGAYTVTGEVRSEPVLLVDDIVGSRWTLTEVGRELRKAGVEAVYPFALAERRGG